MNLPNKITIFRVLLIPVFVLFIFFPMDLGELSFWYISMPMNHFIAALIFIFASSTDWVDGYLARKLNLVTNFGKFLDPLADKLLVTSALIALVSMDLTPAWMVIVILSREFAVTGFRMIASKEGAVIAADNLGKWKTVFQIIAISLLLLHDQVIRFGSVGLGEITMWVAVILTVVSGVNYFLKNKHVISVDK